MKPIYIETDEEITSIIDRLRTSLQKRNVFVVPIGALLLQSSVNMRLLLRESEKLQREVIIVTPDENGHILATKVGIAVYESLDSIDGIEIDEVGVNVSSDIESKDSTQTQIGTSSYYEESVDAKNSSSSINVESSNITNSTPVDKMRQFGNIDVVQKNTQHRNKSVDVPYDVQQSSNSTVVGQYRQKMSMDKHREQEVQEFFGQKRGENSFNTNHSNNDLSISPYTHSSEKYHKYGRSAKIIFGSVIAVVVMVAIAFVLYIFFPRVTVVLTPTITERTSTVNILASAGLAEESSKDKNINLISFYKEETQTLNFPATGTSTAGNFKARGTVTIINSYSKKAQPLVATTRVITKEGILFRLVDRVVVPGVTVLDGVTTPGSVKVKVIADKSGEESNIEASEFTIPGFRGTAKYIKFSAKSEMSMVGGSSTGGTKKVVTSDDIENAKKEAEEKIISFLKDEIRSDAKEQDKTVLDDMMHVNIVSSDTPVVSGIAASSFDYHIRATVTGLAFSEENVRSIIVKDMGIDSDESDNAQDVIISYSPSLTDFDKQTSELTANGMVRIVPSIDVESVRNSLRGKKKLDVNTVLSDFDGIDQAELQYKSGFLVGHMPWYTKSITVIVKDLEN